MEPKVFLCLCLAKSAFGWRLESDLQRLRSKTDFRQDPTPFRENVTDDLLYQPELFEGDILGLSADSIHAYVEELNVAFRVGDHYKSLGDVLRYQAIREESKLWRDGLVPYTVSSLYTPQARAVILEAIRIFGEETCIQWRERSVEPDYVFLSPAGGGCSSFVGRQGGRQRIQLGPDCLSLPGIVLHELMHSVGFFHEQSRADRDAFVKVNWDNVHPVWNSNFRKYRLDYISQLDAPYDYASIMHYGPFAFSRNGLRTIQPLDPVQGKSMGQRRRLSPIDVTKINRLYGCLPASTRLPLDTTTSQAPVLPTDPEQTATSTTPLPTDPTTTPAMPTDPTTRMRIPTDPTQRPTRAKPTDSPVAEILYHPYECYVREDQGKLLYWPAEGFPRSTYQCEIRADPRSWRGFRPHLRRVSCQWLLEGRRCSVPAAAAALCWQRFYLACPKDAPIPTDVLPPLPTSPP